MIGRKTPFAFPLVPEQERLEIAKIAVFSNPGKAILYDIELEVGRASYLSQEEKDLLKIDIDLMKINLEE